MADRKGMLILSKILRVSDVAERNILLTLECMKMALWVPRASLEVA